MKPHIENKTEVDKTYLTKTANKMSEVGKSLVKILGIGKESGQEKRALGNAHVFPQTELPVIHGLHKDHKPGRDKRPVVNGNVGPASSLSNILSDVGEYFVDELRETMEQSSSCKSTEELISQFLEFNNNHDNQVESDRKFVASLDVKSLFPSLRTEQCVSAFRQVISNSKIRLEGLNHKEMGIMLRKNYTSQELKDKNLDHLVPIKLKKPKNSEKVKSGDKNNCYDLWSFPKESLTESEIRIMFAEIIAVGVTLVMNNHVFAFDNKVYVQINEGSTGVRLTGIMSEIVMILWCCELARRLENVGVENSMMPRFVDDITLVPSVVPPGWKINSAGKLEFIEEFVEEDSKIPEDKRTMDIVKNIADNISENIKVTYDIPSNHDDHRVPILDLKAGVNKEGKIETSCK